MSPGSILRKWYTSLLTSTLSPIASVSCMDPVGMKNACTTNDLISSAITSAMTMSTGSSARRDRGLRGVAPPSSWTGCSCVCGPVPAGSGCPPSRCWERGCAVTVSAATSGCPPGLGGTVARLQPGLSSGSIRTLAAGVTRPWQQHARRGGARGLLGRRGFAPLADPGGLAAQVAEVVQLGATDPAAGHDLDLVDGRGVHREGPLHADAVADLADGEGLACPAALAADHHALENLDPGPVALLDPDVHLQRVARPEARYVGANLRLLELGNRGVHRCSSLIVVSARLR